MTSQRALALLFRASIVAAAFLLFSIGGAAIWAAPVTVPLLSYVIVQKKVSRPWRILSVLVLALTIAEAAWALVYLIAGEAQPAIWLVATLVLAMLAAGCVALRLRRPVRL